MVLTVSRRISFLMLFAFTSSLKRLLIVTCREVAASDTQCSKRIIEKRNLHGNTDFSDVTRKRGGSGGAQPPFAYWGCGGEEGELLPNFGKKARNLVARSAMRGGPDLPKVDRWPSWLEMQSEEARAIVEGVVRLDEDLLHFAG